MTDDFESIRIAIYKLVERARGSLPASREVSLAIAKLEEASQWLWTALAKESLAHLTKEIA